MRPFLSLALRHLQVERSISDLLDFVKVHLPLHQIALVSKDSTIPS